ncbi:hypothetical protein [Streptomyces sp. NPDC101237]|uniref:hypothetical protein n=1 Tax=Streptomyces sp. NPDC101237 TaxID=3366139 RepID=UPI00380FAE0C
MGVFARFLGKKRKTTEEPVTEAPASVEPDGSAARDAVKETAEETAGASVTEGTDADGGESAAAPAQPAPVAAGAAESTEIPRQQSAKEAADNEVGEGVRT